MSFLHITKIVRIALLASLLVMLVALPDAQAAKPVITYVTPLNSNPRQTITIQGSGFGNLQPKLTRLDDGSEDTQSCNATTPWMRIVDNNGGSGPHSWDAGLGTCYNNDSIGIFLQSWSDSEIVLSGFGTNLGNWTSSTTFPGSGTGPVLGGRPPFSIAPGDSIFIEIFGPSNSTQRYSDEGASYSLTVASPPTPKPTGGNSPRVNYTPPWYDLSYFPNVIGLIVYGIIGIAAVSVGIAIVFGTSGGGDKPRRQEIHWRDRMEMQRPDRTESQRDREWFREQERQQSDRRENES